MERQIDRYMTRSIDNDMDRQKYKWMERKIEIYKIDEWIEI